MEQQGNSALFAETQGYVDDLKLVGGGKLAIATSHLTGRFWDGEIVVYELKQRKRNYATSSGNSGVAWVGDKTDYVAAAGDDASVTLWLTSETGNNPKISYKEHDDIVSSLATNPVKMELLASGSWDAKIKLWSLTKEESLATLEGHLAAINSLAWQQNSEHLLFSASQDTTAKQWDVRQKACVNTFSCHSPVFAIQTSQDEHTLVTGEEEPILSLYDLRKPGETVQLVHPHEDSIRRVCFSPHTPTLLACASDDATVSVLDLSSRSTVVRFDQHTDFVRGLAWDLDNKGSLLSGGWDKKVYAHTIVGQ